MQITPHNPTAVFPAYRNYAHAVEVPAGARTLYINGLNGFEPDGVTMPADFAGQAALVWRHLGAILGSAGIP
jgi:2-iminobutanoate/2-iminopropanoate deaminase